MVKQINQENKPSTVYLDGETSIRLLQLASKQNRSKSNFVKWFVDLFYDGRIQITEAGRIALEEHKE
jgi:hypothetical protein